MFTILLTLNAEASSNSILKCFSKKDLYAFSQQFKRQSPLQNDAYPLFAKNEEDAFDFREIEIFFDNEQIQKITTTGSSSLVSHFEDVESLHLDKELNIAYDGQRKWNVSQHKEGTTLSHATKERNPELQIPSVFDDITEGCLYYSELWKSPLQIDVLKEQAVLFHYQPEGETYNLDVYTQSPVQLHQDVMTNLKIPQSQTQPLLRMGLGYNVFPYLDENQQKYIGDGMGVALYKFNKLERKALMNGEISFEMYLPLQSKLTNKPLQKSKIKLALCLLPKLRKLEFSKKDGDVYENEQFRMYIQDGGVVLTSLDRKIYSDEITYMNDDFVSYSKNQSFSLQVMIPRQFQMMIGPLPFVRIRAMQFQDDWGKVQLSSVNTQLNGILHSFVIPAISFVTEDYPDELVIAFMGYLSGDLSEETKTKWMERNSITGEIYLLEEGVEYFQDGTKWQMFR